MKHMLIYERPCLAWTGDGRLRRLVGDWRIVYRGEEYVVPSGFETDGASIPILLVPICGSRFEKPRLYAAIVHDALYAGVDQEATRADADDLYRDLQIALGIPRWKAYLEWRVLRLFGWIHWRGKKSSGNSAGTKERTRNEDE